MKNPLQPPYNIDLDAIFRSIEILLDRTNYLNTIKESSTYEMPMIITLESCLKMELQKWKQYQADNQAEIQRNNEWEKFEVDNMEGWRRKNP